MQVFEIMLRAQCVSMFFVARRRLAGGLNSNVLGKKPLGFPDISVATGIMTPVRAQLRNATVACHDRVEAAFSVFDIASPYGYATFLAAQAAALIPVEQAIEEAGIDGVLPDWKQRTRRAALWRDLEILGQTPAPSVVFVAPDGPAPMLGMAYVLEGSRLGGAVLLRRALGGPHSMPSTATEYLRHGAGSGLWQSFLATIEAAGFNTADLAKMTAGAVLAFGAFENAARTGKSMEADHGANHR